MPTVRPLAVPALLLRRSSESRPLAVALDAYDVIGKEAEEPTCLTHTCVLTKGAQGALRKGHCMTKNALILAAAALLAASGIASAQTQTPPQYDSSGAPVPPGSTVTPRPNTGNTPNDPPAGTSGQALRDERLPADRDSNVTPVPIAPPASAPNTQSR
jgi:hypothetical protein